MKNAVKIIAQLADAGVEVYLSEDKLKARSLKGGLTSDLLNIIKLNKPEIIEYLTAQIDTNASNRRPAVTAIERKSPYISPSYAQQRLWFIDQMEGGSQHYNMPSAMRLSGQFKLDVAGNVFTQIIQRHEVLRTVYIEQQDGPMQFINESFKFSISHTDLSHLAKEQQQVAIKTAIQLDANKLFDLTQDLMLRVTYLQINDESGVLLFNMHHIASDGWSIGVLVNEFVKRYTAKVTGDSHDLKPLVVQYADYAQQQRQWLTGEVLEKQLKYWDQNLKDIPPIHHLPLDYERPQLQTFSGATLHFQLNHNNLTQLKLVAQQNQVTLFMLMHAAFAVLIARYSNHNDVVIGTPVANRMQQELEPLIGFFVNTLVLRADCSDNPSFIDFLKQIKQTNINAQANQDVPFEHLVERLNPERSINHNALFQIMLSMNTNEPFDFSLPELQISAEKRTDEITAKFDLVLLATPIEGNNSSKLNCTFEYNTKLFSAQTIQRLANSLISLLKGISLDANQKLVDLPLIDAEQTKYLLNTLNDTQMDYPKHLSLQHLFEQQVKKTPNQIAVVYDNHSLSYLKLNQRANQLAHYLIEQGTQADEIIGLCFDRCLDMMVAILAILKSGAAYLPLDPSHPQGRLLHMIEDAEVSKIVTQKHLSAATSGQGIHQCISDDVEMLDRLADCSTENPTVVDATSASLAYVIYTSGSTGKPKGVMIEHRQAVHSVFARKQFYRQDVDRFLLISPIAFDSSVAGIMWTLLFGGRLIIPNKASITDSDALMSLIEQHQISHTLMTPALYSALLGVIDPGLIKSLQVVIVAGESVPQSLPKTHHELLPKTHLFNEYGPTEGSVWSTATELLPDDDQPITSIGKAISNVRLYVLDKHHCLLPLGAVGELYIAGDGLARGYLNQKTLTAEKFKVHHLSHDKTERLYQTGDLVRYLDSGELTFVRRVDQQLKIRGYRVEVGEIEHYLTAHPAVENSVVVAHQVTNEAIHLVAYFTTKSNAAEADLIHTIKSSLQHHLPDYMMPSVMMLLPSMPLTNNGKIDRKALPKPVDTAQQIPYVAPEGETQIKLANIWASLLKIPVDKISAQASFFALGGHSLLSIRLLAEVRKNYDCELSVRDIFEKSNLSDFADLIKNAKKGGRPLIKKIQRNHQFLMPSFAQQRLWFIDQMDGGSAHYNIPSAIRLQGSFDVLVAETAFRQIIERHEVLRTVFIESESGGPLQIIKSQFEFSIASQDLSEMNSEQQQHTINQAVKYDAELSFDLNKDLMIRVSHMVISDDESVLLFNMHHIASDGWSMGILINEFVKLYDSNLCGHPSPLAPLDIQYADYAYWQQNWLNGELLKNQLDYWDQQLADLPQVHNLPLDFERPKFQTFNGASQQFQLDNKTYKRLKNIALENKVTLFMVIHAAFSILIARFSNCFDVVIGIPVANRLQKELEPLIGFFVNTLVLRVDCSQSQSFIDFLKQIKNINLDAQANQDVPFEHLVDRLNPVRNTSHNALFQVMLSMNPNEGLELSLPGVEVSAMQTTNEKTAKFDLVLNAVPNDAANDGGLYCSFEYNTDLFTAATIERFTASMVLLLTGIADDAKRNIASLPLVSKQEKEYLLSQFNDTVIDSEGSFYIHQLFEQQAEKTPENTAVVFKNKSLSYSALNSKANQLAHYLIEQGVKPDELVGICVERSLDMIVGILAILKAGGAYIPLDPVYPKGRLEHMMQDSGISMVLTQTELSVALLNSSIKHFLLDDVESQNRLNNFSIENPAEIDLTPNHLAYVIYTSGSTGKPKGVMIEHKDILIHIVTIVDQLGFVEEDRFLQFSSMSFDSFIEQTFASLAMGASLFLRDESLWSAEEFYQFSNSNMITVVDLPPVYLMEMLTSNEANGFWSTTSLRIVVIGGERVPQSLIRQWLKLAGKSQCQLFNAYGPTETTITSHLKRIEKSQVQVNSKVSIGRVLPGRKAYILDQQQNLTPKLLVGELYIGGHGLARGYLNQPELSNEKFIEHKFSESQIERLYRTGDLVRYLPDGSGEIEFIERIDDQIKLRGFRIELGEIEHLLSQQSDINSNVAIVREDTPGQKRIVSYYVSESACEEALLTARIKAKLADDLPSYMIPSFFVRLKSIPITPNGKVDKSALHKPEIIDINDQQNPPSGQIEKDLSQIWSELLNLPVNQISANDNFFELGGHSLLSIRLLAEIRNTFGCELSVQNVFEYSELSDLANQIKQSESVGRPQIIAIQRKSNQTLLSFAQQRLWFIDQIDGGSTQYNMPSIMRMTGAFDVDVAENSFRQIIRRHEILRTVFKTDTSGPIQIIEDDFQFSIKTVDLTQLSKDEQQISIQRAVKSDASKAFDLTNDLMLRVSYLRLSESVGVLLFNMHHIASDGWSVGVLTKEFVTLYQSGLVGTENSLAPLKIQYADYAHWQRNWLQGEVLEHQLSYWDQQLAELPLVHSLPLDFVRPQFQTFNGAAHQFELNANDLTNLNRTALENQATLFMVIHAAFCILISRYSNSTDVVMGTPVANRLQKELEPLIGFFVNTLVLRADCSQNLSFVDFLKQIKGTNLDAQTNQDVPFEHLVDRLNPARSTSHNALFQVMISMNTNESIEMTLPNVTISPVLNEHTVMAKFDLVLMATVAAGRLLCTFEYNTDLFKPKTIERMADSLIRLLCGIGVDANQKLADLPLLSKVEMHQLLLTKNDTQVDFPSEQCVHQLFEQQVERTPSHVAVVFEGQSLTYAELNNQTNQLAHYLIEEGIKPDDVIGLCFDRSLEMLIGLIGIMKAGAAYLPLDPNHPKDRLDYIIKDADLSYIITHKALSKTTVDRVNHQLILDDSVFLNTLNQHPTINPMVSGLVASNLAYIIYTSGSTGTPKGVMIEHRNVVHSVHARTLFYTRPVTKILLIPPITFDGSVAGMMWSLFSGSQLVIPTTESILDVYSLIKLIQGHQISHSLMTPALYSAILKVGQPGFINSLKVVILGGESFSKTLLQRHSKLLPKTQLFNEYGPTEGCVWSTSIELFPLPNHAVQQQISIGKAISNVQLYVLDQNKSLLPTGTVGELYIGGEGLARGYLNLPELTEEKFSHHNFDDGITERLYQTGDLVRYLDDGNLEFMGRIDNQVKIRGFRIELGEIEFRLSELTQINSCIVVVIQNHNAEKSLAAFVTLNAESSSAVGMEDQIKKALKNSLPNYMIPSFITILDKLPVTQNGKVDSAVLSTLKQFKQEQTYLPPANDNEELMLKVITKELGFDSNKISMHANYFDLGGNSLSLINVIHKLDLKGFKRSIKLFYECATLKQVCEAKMPMFSSTEADSLIRLNATTQGIPLYLVHPMGGRADCYLPLAKQLESNCPVYGIQAPFVAGHTFEFDQLSELAAFYAAAIIAHQPLGPYRLGGWSIGGLIAQKIVEVLNNAGKTVEYFIGIDSFMIMPNHYKDNDYEALKAVIAFVRGETILDENFLPKNFKDKRLTQQLETAAELLNTGAEVETSLQNTIKGLKFGISFLKVKPSITQQIISNKSFLFIANDNPDKEMLINGWQQAFSPGSIFHSVPGKHLNILEGESFTQIAHILTTNLNP